MVVVSSNESDSPTDIEEKSVKSDLKEKIKDNINYFGIGIALSLGSQVSGINAVMGYSSDIFGDIRYVMNLIQALLQIICCFLFSPLLKIFPLK
jgi:Sugar (and other) transporter